MTQNILVVKLSALGDFIQNFGAMRAIREHHKNDQITLLTTKTYAGLGQDCDYFDNVIIDERPRILQPKKWLSLGRTLNKGAFNLVYDLQNNDRSRLYHSLLLKNVTRIGLDKGANKKNLAFYRHKDMLEKAGLSNITIDQMDWMKSDTNAFNLPDQYTLIVPGCAPTRPEKRWPAEYYTELCQHLTSKSLTPVILGTKDEEDITNQISAGCPQAINLTGKTKLTDIPTLASGAALAVGNDTGPMHMIAPTGCKILALFSGYSQPDCHKPLGENVYTLQEPELKNLSVEKVIQRIAVL